ncbi:MAG: hypothetical protein AAF690_08470 [Acidobacteriota bacterium]
MARIVDGLLDLDRISDAELDFLLENAEDEEQLVRAARAILGENPDHVGGSTMQPAIGGEKPDLIAGIFRRGFRVLRGGKV